MANEPDAQKREAETETQNTDSAPKRNVSQAEHEAEVTDANQQEANSTTTQTEPPPAAPNRFRKVVGRTINWLKCKVREPNMAEWMMVLFTVVIAGATIAYTEFARRQWRVMAGQLAEMKTGGADTHALADWAKAQTRAWVSAEVKISGPITLDARGAELRFSVKIVNTGRSPAFRVDIWPKVINQQNPVIRREQLEICGRNPDGTGRPMSNKVFWGGTLFPGADETHYYALTVIPKELANSNEFDGYFKGRFMPGILGCVDYAIDPTGERHQTFFSYTLMTVVAPGKNDFSRIGENIPLDKVVTFRDWQHGSGAN